MFSTIGAPVFDLDRVEMWAAIRDVVEEASLGDWMFMARYALPGSRFLYSYKHKESRRCLNLDSEGVAYSYDSTRNLWMQIDQAEAIAWAHS